MGGRPKLERKERDVGLTHLACFLIGILIGALLDYYIHEAKRRASNLRRLLKRHPHIQLYRELGRRIDVRG